ncbi:putative NDP-hexose 3-C-methyltransferase protein [Azorhizobium caulinodans ORS 571]|uniref:Putative NDP-hexose 3-C-methyltransferase protein n=1 Tax=Azorhizobium caulinodans (strain ATCC 43989 / DSM 5975 / JCM 20966 / LMG 6465 / NBRC 14845 / NCIMB 13405 / ORS 571) TaxID=438753 RepID=A8IED7_AZOC5|nr:class I SAM-dependent methyltransferase [Azorhizobium caulinodans]BAF89476.1 putative NDP-hexose 3-C-methyltransferase protein [Azorhizobium caulinodans ORS 571]
MKAGHCRFCNTPLSLSFVDLGSTPLANSYVPLDRADAPEPSYPLRASVCGECRLVQADAFVPAEDIFSHYAYFSSFSDSWVAHARRFAHMAMDRFGIGAQSLVVEVASNDGYLLRHFVEAGVPVLGIEPAANVAEAARVVGVRTEAVFFGAATGDDIKAREGGADLVVANNVLAHVPDINDFVEGFARVLKPEGVISIEFPHLLRLIEDVQFDTVYHEHFYYLSLLAVEKVMAAHGLRVFDVEEWPTHGGSLRVFACLKGARHEEQPGVAKVRADEAAAGLDRDEIYADFQRRVTPIREGLVAFLRQAKAEGKRVAAYGAAAKGNTLLNFSGVGTDLIDYVVDRNPHKQGHLLPGSHLPVHAPEKLAETKPDYVLILPWNIKDEVVASHAHVRDWGGRFVIAVPRLTVLP